MRRTPLHIAVIEGQIKVVSNLINQGVNVNAKDYEGKTPLQLAIELNDLDIFKLLITRKIKVDILIVCLFKAIKSNNESMLKLLIQACNDLNIKYVEIHSSACSCQMG